MSIPAAAATWGSLAPGALRAVLSTVLGARDKVLTRGALGLGERRGTAAVPSGAGRGGTAEGGQERCLCTPRRVLQVLSRRGQTLLGSGRGYPPCAGRGSHPAAAACHPTRVAGREPGAVLAPGCPAWAAAPCWLLGDTPGLVGGAEPDAGSVSVPCLPRALSYLGTLALPCLCPWPLGNHGSALACPAPCSLWALPTS